MINVTKEKCKFCEEISEDWNDDFEGVIHHLPFIPNYEKDSKFYHKDTHIYETNGKGILDVENFQYVIYYCPFCGRKIGAEK